MGSANPPNMQPVQPERSGRRSSGAFRYRASIYTGKILFLASKLVFPLIILYLSASLTLKIVNKGYACQRLPIVIVAALLALASAYLYINPRLRAKEQTHPFAYWGLLFLGIMCELLVPSAPLNRQAEFMAIIIAASSIGLLVALLRYWALTFIVPLILLLVANAFLSFALNIQVDAYFMSEILAASPQDVEQFLTCSNILCAGFTILFVIGLAYLLTGWAGTERRWILAGTSSMILVASILISQVVFFPTMSYASDEGIGIVNAIVRFQRAFSLAKARNDALAQKIERISSLPDSPSSISTLQGGEGVTVILHMGESVRSDRVSINGYERNTTPWLKSCSHLINFPNCTASTPSTKSASLAILTNARGNMEFNISPELEASSRCIMDFFAANSFECYGFFNALAIDKQETWGVSFEKAQAMFTAKAKKVYELDNFGRPKNQIPQIATVLRSVAGNKFFLVNNSGSHTPFFGYDPQHATFLPSSGRALSNSPQSNAAAAEEVNNAYDNTIVYTDEYIHDVIDMLKGTPFLYIYVSDHGEPLGDGGKWARYQKDFHKAEWSKVAFFIIYSTEFEQLHPHFKEALVNLRKNSTMATAHENIFHTLLGIFGIQTPHYEAIHDLSSPNPEPYQGPSCDRNGETLDGLKWE